MRHSFYVNVINARRNKTDQAKTQSRSVNYHKPDQLFRKKKTPDKDSEDKILALRISSTLNKHKDNPEIIKDVQNRIQMFEVNRTIARDLNNEESEKALIKQFVDYLSKI